MYDWNVGVVGLLVEYDIRTPCTFPSGERNETYQYEPGGCGFAPASVLSWKRSLTAPLGAIDCDSQSALRSVPAVPERLSPVASVRMRWPGSWHGSCGGGGGAGDTSLLAGPSPFALTAVTL